MATTSTTTNVAKRPNSNPNCSATSNSSSSTTSSKGPNVEPRLPLGILKYRGGDAAIEGQLYKYTNVVKGWQYRWFLLSPGRGSLEYFMPDEKKKVHPRGCVYLAGSMIAPSDEDSQTFSVAAACGEVYKLKAADTKERQFWVDKLRLVAGAHESRISQQLPPLPRHPSPESTSSLNDVRDLLLQTQRYQRGLVTAIESFTQTDEDLLLLKATSHSTIMALEQCFAILQSIRQQRP